MSDSTMECLACSQQFDSHQLDAGVCPVCGGECDTLDAIYDAGSESVIVDRNENDTSPASMDLVEDRKEK